MVYLFSSGGGHKANRIFIEGLAQRNHTCRAVAIRFSTETVKQGMTGKEEIYSEEKRLSAVETSYGTTFHRNGVEVMTTNDHILLATEMFKTIKKLDPDWVIVSEDVQTRYHLLEGALEVCSSQVVYLSHSPWTLPFGPDCNKADPAKAQLFSRVAGIITVSNYLRDYICRWGSVNAETIYFPSYGDGPFAHFNNYDRGYVTMINPSAIKGISIFLEMAKAMPDVEFAAVPTWASMPEDVRSLQELPNMKLLKPAHMDKILGLTRVLVVPSLWAEAFGQVVVEAMLRGIPVMASDSGGLPEAKLGLDYILPVRMIERYQDYVPEVPEQDTRPWIETLRELLGDRQIYERLSEESREKALEFVSRLGIEPFEEYLKGLSGREEAGEEMSEEKQRDPRARELQGQVDNLSPERRALLARRLKKQMSPQKLPVADETSRKERIS